MYDILLKNGLIVDGMRTKPYKASIAIKDGKIAKINPSLREEEAKEVIDVRCLVVSPGFIDIHTHSDASFIEDDRSESKIYQGVTTEVVGQCGRSFYPCQQGKKENLDAYIGGKSKNMDRSYFASYTFTEYIDKAKVQRKKMSTNWATMIGHNAIRASVMRFEGRKATKAEIHEMVQLLDREMASGAWGLSLGLGYTPGIFSDIEELSALGEVVAKYDGMIASHMRNQGNKIYEALDEMFEINRRTGAHVHIAHLKLSGKPQWGKAEELLNYIRNAQSMGVNVTCDIYPYEAASSGITNILPKWALEGGKEKAAGRFIGTEREKIMVKLDKKFEDKSAGDRIYIVSTNGLYPLADDKTITELADELNLSLSEAVERVIIETKGNCRQISFAMDEKDMLRMIKEIDIAIGSDGYGLPLNPQENDGKPHPRNFGTFPRFLRLAREHSMMPIEDAVYKMTGLSAEMMGFKDRGVLKEGLAADITIFDSDKVSDLATYKNPFLKPIGIYYVIVNGEVVISNGEQTDKRPGRFLLKNT